MRKEHVPYLDPKIQGLDTFRTVKYRVSVMCKRVSVDVFSVM